MNPGSANALLGATGFVGGHLREQMSFTDLYHRPNIASIAGRSFETVVCAAAPAQKWWANQNVAADWENIESLLNSLKQVRANEFFLISTVDVYAKPNGATEADVPPKENHAYGTHRLKIEEFVREHFKNHYILRLPGLFGHGLKKNVLFDLLHSNCLEQINPNSVFQYYNLENLSSDMAKMRENKIRVLNLATEPISTKEIWQRYFSNLKIGEKANPAAQYDFQTRYGKIWGRNDAYLYGKESVLTDLGKFFKSEQEKKA